MRAAYAAGKDTIMATTMTNQALLQFSYGATTATASSNIATTVIQGPLSASKSVLESSYQAGSDLTYLITLTNSGAAALSPVTIVDDCGAYAVSPTLSVAPLFYTDPAQLYINGVFSANLTPAPGINSITFTIPSIPANSNAMLIYKAHVDDFAPLAVGSSITNTATVSATGLSESVVVTASVNVADYADVSIIKSLTPNPITDGSTLTSTFTIYNYGNTAATDVVLRDTFSPVPDPITVTVNGAVLAATDFSYANGLLTLPAAGSAYALSVPAASFVQNPATGVFSTNPGTVVITVSGVI